MNEEKSAPSNPANPERVDDSLAQVTINIDDITCPFTLEIFHTPIMLLTEDTNGNIQQGTVIEQEYYLRYSRNVDPITNLPVRATVFNRQIRNLVEQYFQSNPQVSRDQQYRPRQEAEEKSISPEALVSAAASAVIEPIVAEGDNLQAANANAAENIHAINHQAIAAELVQREGEPNAIAALMPVEDQAAAEGINEIDEAVEAENVQNVAGQQEDRDVEEEIQIEGYSNVDAAFIQQQRDILAQIEQLNVNPIPPILAGLARPVGQFGLLHQRAVPPQIEQLNVNPIPIPARLARPVGQFGLLPPPEEPLILPSLVCIVPRVIDSVSSSSSSSVPVCKTLLIGNNNTKKSLYLLHLMNNNYVVGDRFIQTIGIDFSLLSYEGVKYQIWDTAGQERFRTVTTAHYRNAELVYIFGRTPQEVQEWLIRAEQEMPDSTRVYSLHYNENGTINLRNYDPLHIPAVRNSHPREVQEMSRRILDVCRPLWLRLPAPQPAANAESKKCSVM